MFNSDNIYPGVKVTPEEFAQKCDLKIFFNAGKEIELHSMIVNRPGLMLAGYKNDFAEKRVQLMGKTEIGFLQDNDKYIEAFFAKNIPCVVLSRGFPLPR